MQGYAGNMSYRSSNVFSEYSVSLVGPHVEQRLSLAKASSDIMSGFIHISVVDLGEFFVIADQQQCRGNANNGACETLPISNEF